jgi:putative ABC transport system ATP-binding protein
LIEARGASLVYIDHGKEIYACRGLNLEVAEGEFLGILGPSGSGKSSLLYLLSGLKVPTAGSVFYNNADLASLSDEERSTLRIRSFGFVFQQPFLLGYLTALENTLVTAKIAEKRREAEELLDALGLGDKMHRLPHELSGGERQRVCVARALLGGPRAIFADEPTASLDHANGSHVVHMLNRHRGAGALVMVTHDPTMLAEANRILHISDGTIAQETLAET